MITKQVSGTLFRALSVLLVILLLAILVGLLLLIANENNSSFPMLPEIARLLSGEAGVTRPQTTAVVIILLGAAALPMAITLISLLSRDARMREHQHVTEIEQLQRELQVLYGSEHALSETNRTRVRGIDQANERIDAAVKTCREVSQQLLDGSRFESAHLLAAGSIISGMATVMDEMTLHAEDSAAVARESMQLKTDAAGGTAQRIEEAFSYLADLSRRIAQVSQKQSASVADVGASFESISEISRRSAASAAVLNDLADDLQQAIS